MLKFRFVKLLGVPFGMPFKFDWSSDLTSLSGSLFNMAGSIMSSKLNADEVAEENQKAYERNVEFWNMNNEYNTPSAQLQRLQDAGINPALAISGGLSNTSTLQSSPSYAQTQKGAIMSQGFQKAAEMLMMRNQLKQQAAQTELFKSQNSIAEEEAKIKAEKAEQESLETQRKRDFADTWKNGFGEGVVFNVTTGKLETVSADTNPDDVVSPLTFGSQGKAEAFFDFVNKVSDFGHKRAAALSDTLYNTITTTQLADKETLSALADLPKNQRMELIARVVDLYASARGKDAQAKYTNFMTTLEGYRYGDEKNSNLGKLLSDAFDKGDDGDYLGAMRSFGKALVIGLGQFASQGRLNLNYGKHTSRP